jgi:N-acetylneuraminic acid mutarotase
LLNPRNHTSGAAVGGYVYCIGGQYNQEENQIAQRDIHRYDPTTDTWEKVAELPTVRSHTNASTFVWNNKIMIIGGETGFGEGLRNVTVFDPITNTFTEMSPLPEARSTSVAGVLPDGRLISATGNTPSPSVETYIGTIS